MEYDYGRNLNDLWARVYRRERRFSREGEKIFRCPIARRYRPDANKVLVRLLADRDAAPDEYSLGRDGSGSVLHLPLFDSSSLTGIKNKAPPRPMTRRLNVRGLGRQFPL
jgi:hypothetical protein